MTMPRFDLEGLLDIIEEHGVTWLHIVPPVVLAFANAPQIEGRDFSKLKMVICGAAPLDAELAERAEERIGAPIRQGYGMTELSPVSHKSPFARAAETPPGSVGPLLPNTEARLVDPDTGEDAAEGEEGEVWIRGPQVMVGYLENPEATAETLGGRRLAAHRRHRPARRGGLLLHRRPAQGADQVQGLPGAPGRAGGGARLTPADQGRRRDRGPRRGRRARCRRPASWSRATSTPTR